MVLIVMVCRTWVKNWNMDKLINVSTTPFFNNRRSNHLKTMNLLELKTLDLWETRRIQVMSVLVIQFVIAEIQLLAINLVLDTDKRVFYLYFGLK
jgi:hypothetical protein